MKNNLNRVFATAAVIGLMPFFAAAHEPTVCTTDYNPICGARAVQCIQAPCHPIYETFNNTCELENAHAIYIHDGACTEKETGPYIQNTKRKVPVQITIGGKPLTSVSIDLSDVSSATASRAPDREGNRVSFWKSLWISIESFFRF